MNMCEDVQNVETVLSLLGQVLLYWTRWLLRESQLPHCSEPWQIKWIVASCFRRAVGAN